MIKLFYDTTPLENFPCGVAVYTHSLLKQLVCNSDLEIHTGSKRMSVSGHRRLSDFVSEEFSGKIKYHPIFFPGRFSFPAFWGMHPFSYNAEKYDIAHFTAHIMPPYVPYSDLGNAVLSVHDMFLWHKELGRQLNEQEKYHVRVLPSQIQQARAVITCSEFSKREIVKYTGAAPDKIFVIPDAAQWNAKSQIADASAVAGYGLSSKKYFISVSSLDPHKNHLTLLEAFSQYRSSGDYAGEKLVIVGRRRAGDDKIYQKMVSMPDVVHLENISEDILRQLYLNASGFFLLSCLEGFGIPLLEAMSCGIPACYAVGTSMDEIGRDAAFGVDAFDINAVKELFLKFSASGDDVSARVQKARQISLEYTWEKCAERTIGVYHQLCGK